MLVRNRMSLAVVVFLPALVGGCGAKTEGPELAPVQGTVTYRGKPVENAFVVFLPDKPGVRLANAITDADGYYELFTIVPGDGAIIGRHRVTVTARGPDKPGPEEDSTPGVPNIIPGDPLIPEKYFSFDTSGLTAEVTPDGITANFDLIDP